VHGLEIIAIAVGLGADAMSVCMGIGVRWHGPRQKLRLAWHMGLFQALMPIIGWLAGSSLAGALHSVGKYVAAGLLLLVALKMLLEAIKSHPGSIAEHAAEWEQRKHHVKGPDPTRGWALMGLSVATSIDALLVGVSLSLKGRGIWLASLVIGLVAGAMALIGVAIGKRFGKTLGKPAEILGAVVLIVLAGIFLFW